MFRRNPVITATAVLSLAIGIGAATTIFTVADGLLFRAPAGVSDPDRLVDVGRSQDGAGFDTNSYPNFLDVRERSTAFSGTYAYPIEPETVTVRLERGEPLLAHAGAVSAGYFGVLGARPALGRFFTADDGEEPGGPALVVLSHRLFAGRFGSDPAVVGKTIAVNGVALSVAGVAEPDFQGTTLLVPDLWYPVTMAPRVTPRLGPGILGSRASAWLLVGARLKPGVTLARARAELGAIGKSLAREYPEDNAGRGLVAERSTRFPGNTSPLARFVALLAAIVGSVLAVACANVGGVLLARAAARRREVAVRLAIGARRGRLVRQFLTESGLLFAAGGAGGLLLARALLGLVRRLLPTLPVPVGVPLALDPRVIAFAAVLSMASSILAGLAPALHASRGDVAGALKAGAGGSPRLRLRNAFVVGQVALSLLLLVAAGLFLRALRRAAVIDPGFDAAGVDLGAFDLSTAAGGENGGRAAGERILEAVRGFPGVESASLTAVVPLSGTGLGLGRLTVPGAKLSDRATGFDWDVVEPGYFRTLRIPLVAGRDFTEGDRAGAPDAAIVNEAAARRIWPDGSALGRTLLQDDAPPGAPPRVRALTVVGVARDGKYRFLDEPSRPFIWVPFRQQYLPRVTVVVRGREGRRVAGAVRAAAGPDVPILRAQRLEDSVSAALLPQRIAGGAAGALGVVGLLLAAIGVYGVTAYAVTRRTREIAIRIALGAAPRGVVRMVLGKSLALAATGIAIGLGLAGAVGGLVKALLFGVPPLDPGTFGTVAALFFLVAGAASAAPAVRAAGIHPLDALRSE
jgi:predicted permease